ncbi:MAG TPA: chemotaxis-specific protein-glutamate methyltransferase CheB [Polyangiaceae bacterium]|jgi:two-component system chemotaxis response regulator CheB|nr:chemotaxis-specific protein-glutamate methyltransferase CheB [Polyangiaceae bacterium]
MSLLKVMIVDDSSARRQLLQSMIEGTRMATVVGSAADGSEALRLVPTLKPDLITLDLEMPRMNGFGFLRMLLATAPTPVIVVSSLSQRDNVFKALELGALDFIAAPEGGITLEAQELLTRKLQSIRAVRREQLGSTRLKATAISKELGRVGVSQRPKFLITIASSTGGPSALTRVLSSFDRIHDVSLLIAQHMPGSFTNAFAQRLDRYSRLTVREARDGEAIVAGEALVCPGSQCMEVVAGAQPWVRLKTPTAEDRFVPSADRLFTTAADAYGAFSIGVVLTGMGDDGALGAFEISRVGGQVVVEDEQSAVVYGMPRAAAKAVPECVSLPLDEIATAISRLCQE